MSINPHTILPIFCSLLSLSAGFIVLLKNPRSQINKTFFGLCLAILFWLSFYYITYNFDLHNPIIANWFRISYCGITFIAITFFHYVKAFLKIERVKMWNRINYIYGIIISILILKTNLIVKGLHAYPWGLYPKAGFLHPPYLSYFIFLLIMSLIFLINELSRYKPNFKKIAQVKYVLSAFFIFSFASFDFVPNYGIKIYPLGCLPTTIFILIIAYAILKHQLMDITIVIKKSIVYSLLITSISIIYLISVLTIERVFQSFLGYQTIIGSLLVAVIIAIIFTPLKNKIQYLVDKLFFKGTQIEIAEQNELLRREVAEKEKFKAVATLAGGVAHEIKNPLTAILTFSEQLPKKLRDEEFLNTFSRIVGNEVYRINDLVHQLLDFAKPSPLSLKETNIHNLIDETFDFLNSKFIQHEIKIEKKYDINKESLLSVDPIQLKQVFMNIFLNAIDAMSQGGTLTVITKPIDASLEIIIQDTGCGITKKDLSHIFDPFFSNKDKGTGLGLSITHGIIQEHKGKIRVESAVGQGTSFIIELPTL